MNVASSRDSSSSGICQNPLVASSFEKILLWPNLARLSSTEDIGCISRWTHLFSCVKSLQMRYEPFSFSTVTIAEHHAVGSVTGEITPC